MTCKFCGSTDVRTIPCPPSSPHHAEGRCGACGGHLGWVEAPMTLERARRFTMPYGAFQGLTLAAITATRRGVEYLTWLVAQPWPKPTLRRAVEFHLSHLDNPNSPDTANPGASADDDIPY